ncbi:hypothetical protein KKE92_04715 [Candidatus Micrarchaeota archaeon]|nr:hypothetical protein [Candidatus Micrarchaeota archaeon]
MPNCTVILHRHSRIGPLICDKSSFVADKLKPLVESRMAESKSTHVVHDIAPSFLLSKSIQLSFESKLKNPKFHKLLERFNTNWLTDARKALEKADNGESSKIFDPKFGPEFDMILELNSANPGTVINHLTPVPPEALIELTRFRLEMLEGGKWAKGNIKRAINHIKESQGALSCCNLIRDVEAMAQIGRLGSDAILLRGLGHGYLTHLGDNEIAVVPEGYGIEAEPSARRVFNFADFVERCGVTILSETEPVLVSPYEQSLNTMCGGNLEELDMDGNALLHMMFIGAVRMNADKVSNQEELFRVAYILAKQDLPKFQREVFG